MAGRAVSDLTGSARDYPAELLRLFVCRCPGKGKKVWEAHTASFVPHLPSGKGAGDEPIVLRFFVHNAETCTRHCYEKISPSSTSTMIFDPVRTRAATLSSDFWRLRPSLGYALTRKSFETTGSRQLSRPQRAVLKSRERTPVKPALFDDAIYGKLLWRVGFKRRAWRSNFVLFSGPASTPQINAAYKRTTKSSN